MKPLLPIVVSAMALLASCAQLASCAHTSVAKRSAAEQWDAGVLITVACIIPTVPTQYGSGVIVSKDRVLTAMHVVHCDMDLPPTITIDPGDGVQHDATVEILMPADDIARLRVSADLSKWQSPIKIGPAPDVGERACWSSIAPRPTFRCGTVQPRGAYGMDGIFFDGFAEHGNSGSGMYDSRGRLIGIVTSTLACQTGVYCLGRASGLQGLQWLIP